MNRLALTTPVQYVRGVGPVRAAEFAGLGVRTVADLIEYFPFRHELKPKSVAISSLEEGAVATVVGELRKVRARGPHNRQSIRAQLVDGTGRVDVTWFNSPFLANKLHNGLIVRVTGKVGVFRESASFANPHVTVIEDDDPWFGDTDKYDPVYSGTAKLPGKQIRRIINHVLEETVSELVDFVPKSIRSRRRLPLRRTAIMRYHNPTSADDVRIARRRLAYDEFLICQLAGQLSRRCLRNGPRATPIETTDLIDRRIRGRLPFTLTPGQDRAVAEIRNDLARQQPMNRLLQADVGAGKTAVAVYAALAAIANRVQVAVVAPTEVLAAQHHTKIARYLEGSRVRMAYLAGSTPRAEKRALFASLCNGEVDLVIGTHALFEESVVFHALGLVVIDEQHKFGVAQRASLRRKGCAPHTLVLTATPIPRTLAMTVFGDLDVSTIDTAPPDRQPVVTTLVRPSDEDKAWAFVRRRLDVSEKVFVVYPLVEESESLPLKAARVEVERLSTSRLAGYRLGLLHGRMNPAEKAEVMAKFRSCELDVLVSTTVVEVGVDVPDATVMVVQHAERYGLAQLHQLRGRIGRGTKKSFCMLFAQSAGEAALERLRILCETNDGFRIAEEDLRLRGPGELMGDRQHGIPAFKIADLLTDFALLEEAREDAAEVLRGDERLELRQHNALRNAVVERYGRSLLLVDVA
ncbi:MAG: ATP-dependent DNA helicase RecG [Phycisphaerae bacterium]